MAERIRFHLDENVDPDVARALKRHGIDVTTSIELDMQGQTDDEQVAFIRRTQRVIFTHDADFLRFASKDRDHPGIVYSAKTSKTLGEIIRSLVLIYEILSPEEIAGRVEYL
ncbi:MAG TPA: DUF5615 family PIN-like protein [Anaerolineae bacterium]|nr:DUF5615 family PIN-like protein [Anaerolineae bacterium]